MSARRQPPSDPHPTPVTRPERTTAALQWAPTGVALALLLRDRAYEARLADPSRASSFGELAREAERVVEIFGGWMTRRPPPSSDEMWTDRLAWQDLQKRARTLGIDV